MPRQIPQIRVSDVRSAPPVREVRRNVIQELPPPVVSAIDVQTTPVTREAKPPVIRGIAPPIIDVPSPEIDYPVLDVPTEAEFQEGMKPSGGGNSPEAKPDTRDLPDTAATPEVPSIDIGGFEVPLPDPGPLVAAGSLAVVTTVVTLGATIGVNQAKQALEPLLKQALKKKKIKVKSVKPVLHFIPNENGTTEVIQYTAKGMKVLEGGIEKLEQYLRDQVEIDALWEYDNKLIIDEELSDQLTKEGKKRFKRYFASPASIAKKLGSKFAI